MAVNSRIIADILVRITEPNHHDETKTYPLSHGFILIKPHVLKDPSMLEIVNKIETLFTSSIEFQFDEPTVHLFYPNVIGKSYEKENTKYMTSGKCRLIVTPKSVTFEGLRRLTNLLRFFWAKNATENGVHSPDNNGEAKSQIRSLAPLLASQNLFHKEMLNLFSHFKSYFSEEEMKLLNPIVDEMQKNLTKLEGLEADVNKREDAIKFMTNNLTGFNVCMRPIFNVDWKKKLIIWIYASDKDGGIAAKGKIPWNYPEELEFFKTTTTQWGRRNKNQSTHKNALIMGGVTDLVTPFLPFRFNLVVSKQKTKKNGHYKKEYFPSIEEALTRCQEDDKVENIFFIGGEGLFKSFLETGIEIDYIFHTVINTPYPCDRFIKMPEKILDKMHMYPCGEHKDDYKINFYWNKKFTNAAAEQEKLLKMMN